MRRAVDRQEELSGDIADGAHARLLRGIENEQDLSATRAENGALVR